jgi:hypothetical protein
LSCQRVNTKVVPLFIGPKIDDIVRLAKYKSSIKNYLPIITGKCYISHRSWLSNFSDEILIITQHSQHYERNEVHPFHKTNLQKQREIDLVCLSAGVFNLQ